MTIGEPLTTVRPIRVLHITDHLRVGGLQTVLVNLANSLASRGFEVFVAAHVDGRLWDEVSSRCKRVPAPRKPAGIKAKIAYTRWLRNLVRDKEIQIIHAHQRGVAFLARVASLGLGVRVVEHVHNTFLPVSAPFTSFRSHQLIACGSAIEQMLVKDYKRSPSKITRVNNAVHDKSTGHVMTLPVCEGRPLSLVAVGRLTEQKDPLKYVRLVDELNRIDPGRSLRATWVGGGDLLEDAQKLAEELNVVNIEFVGDQIDVASWINQADVLVLTSRWEGLPLAILEAMSLGRGIIAPNVGNCSEAVRTGTNGLLFDPDASIPSVAKEINSCLSQTTLQEWGTESRRTYEKRFTPKRMVDEVEHVYERATRNTSIQSRS